MGMIHSETLTQDCNPRTNPHHNWTEPRRRSKSEGKEGEGEAYLAAAQRYCLAGAWGKEGRAGGVARRALAKGAPQPGRSTAARSPTREHARRRGADNGAESSARSRSLSLGLRATEREKGRSRMRVRVSADAAGRAFFVRARRSGDRRMRSDDSD